MSRIGGVLLVVLMVAGVWAAPIAAQATGSIEASNQAVQNGSITVAKVMLAQDGWVVAAMDEGGQPGAVLGQTAVKGGAAASNVAIKLSKDVPVGARLWLRLHTDTGRVGTFEFPGPDAPLLISGSPVTAQITVSAASAANAAAPGTLPSTGGAVGALWLLLVAGALIAVGARVRRRVA